jgi:hypothetical protein
MFLMNLQNFVIPPFVSSEPFVKSEPEPHFKLMFTSYVHTSGKETNNFLVKQCFPPAQFFPFKFYLLTAAVLLSTRNDTTTAFPVCIRIDLTEHFRHFQV